MGDIQSKQEEKEIYEASEDSDELQLSEIGLDQRSIEILSDNLSLSSEELDDLFEKTFSHDVVKGSDGDRRRRHTSSRTNSIQKKLVEKKRIMQMQEVDLDTYKRNYSFSLIHNILLYITVTAV